MNRKIQDTDRELILTRYRRDPYAFNAHEQARTYAVTPKTIYNVIARAGLKMKRGRKSLVPPQPLISPPSLNPLSSPSTQSGENQETTQDLLDTLNLLGAPDPLDPPISSKPPKPQVRTGKGPPAIHPPKPPSPGSPEYKPNKSAD